MIKTLFECLVHVRYSNDENVTGGKWMCALDTLIDHKPCVVYSFGSQGMVDFEEELMETHPTCNVHVFDPSMTHDQLESLEQRLNTKHDKQRIWFHQYGLAPRSGVYDTAGRFRCQDNPYSPLLQAHWAKMKNLVTDWSSLGRLMRGSWQIRLFQNSTGPIDNGCRLMAIDDIMAGLGHDWVDIWKMDIEGGEIDFIADLGARPEQMRFTQIILEVHYAARPEKPPATDSAQLLQTLQDNNYHSFFLEVNIWNAPLTCVELAYIKIDPVTGLVINSPDRQKQMNSSKPVRGWKST